MERSTGQWLGLTRDWPHFRGSLAAFSVECGGCETPMFSALTLAISSQAKEKFTQYLVTLGESGAAVGATCAFPWGIWRSIWLDPIRLTPYLVPFIGIHDYEKELTCLLWWRMVTHSLSSDSNGATIRPCFLLCFQYLASSHVQPTAVKSINWNQDGPKLCDVCAWWNSFYH